MQAVVAPDVVLLSKVLPRFRALVAVTLDNRDASNPGELTPVLDALQVRSSAATPPPCTALRCTGPRAPRVPRHRCRRAPRISSPCLELTSAARSKGEDVGVVPLQREPGREAR